MPKLDRENGLCFSVERLEHRRLLAGNVEVTVAGGDLVITGDADANTIRVEHPALGDYKVSALGNTTINGGNAPVMHAGIDDVRIVLYGGDDMVELDGIFEGDLIINGGDGNNTVKTGVADELQVNGDLRIQNRDGFDTFDTHITYVAGDFRIDNRDGGSLTRLIDGGEFSGDFRLYNGDGVDDLEIFGGGQDRVEGRTVIDHGARQAHTTIQSVEFQRDFTLKGDGHNTLAMSGKSIDGNTMIDLESSAVISFSAMQFGNRLSIAGGGGWQSVTLGAVIVEGMTKMDHGGGASETIIGLAELRGGLNLRQGGGPFTGGSPVTIGASSFSGNVSVEGYDHNISLSTFTKNLTIKGKRGLEKVSVTDTHVHDTLRLSMGAGLTVSQTTSELARIQVGGDLKYHATVGKDILTVDDSLISGNVRFTSGQDGGRIDFNLVEIEGNLFVSNSTELFDFDADFLEVEGATAIATGSGHDGVEIDDSYFWGAVQVRTGAGTDVVAVERILTGGIHTTFRSQVMFNLGAHNDNLLIGVMNSAQRHVDFQGALKIIGGSGPDFADVLNNGNQFGGPIIDIGMESVV